jgi:hypothetical protein
MERHAVVDASVLEDLLKRARSAARMIKYVDGQSAILARARDDVDYVVQALFALLAKSEFEDDEAAAVQRSISIVSG